MDGKISCQITQIFQPESESIMDNFATRISLAWQPAESPFVRPRIELAEAEKSQVESRRLSNETSVLKEALMDQLVKWIRENNLTQEDAAVILQITRPRVSYVVNKRICKFTIDALVNMLTKTGKKVHFFIA